VKNQAEKAMTKQIIGAIVVGVMTLNAAISAQAFQGGGPGFTGSPGGGFTGPRGGGFTDSLGFYPGAHGDAGFNRIPPYITRRTIAPLLSGKASGNANRVNSANNLNRANSVNNVGRSGSVNNLHRGNAIDNVNRTNAINNANVNRIGVGWNNPYVGYHQGWVHGYWNGHYPGGFGWRAFGYGYPSFYGAGFDGGLDYGLGMGTGTSMGMMGWGLSSWLYGPMLYDYGYLNYSNPYYRGDNGGKTLIAQQPAIHDYSQPISAQSPPPAHTLTDQARSTFDTVRQAFKRGDYPRSLELVDQALNATPVDPILHEFRALTLFALKRYDEAAPALYAVLSVEPGWDWTTLISLYGNPDTYTQQLRSLEAFSRQSPQSAPAHFVLAYHYLTAEHADAAVRQFKLVTALQPKDALSAQLIQQLEHPQQQVVATLLARAEVSTAQAPAVQILADTPPTGRTGKIDGTWTAPSGNDINIGVTFDDGGRFTWKVSRPGKDQQFQGKSGNENGILTLVEDQSNNTIVGNLRWADETHFVFKVIGAAPGDPGLSFAKKS
jgi:tetratricopeptide (TPR) repeat protein